MKKKKPVHGFDARQFVIDTAKEFVDARAIAIETGQPDDRRRQNEVAACLAFAVADLRKAENEDSAA